MRVVAVRTIREDQVPGGPPNLFLVIIATLAACLGLLYLARGLRAIGRSIATKIGRRTSWPFTVRTLLGGISVFVGVLVVVAARTRAQHGLLQQDEQLNRRADTPSSTLRGGGPDLLFVAEPGQ